MREFDGKNAELEASKRMNMCREHDPDVLRLTLRFDWFVDGARWQHSQSQSAGLSEWLDSEDFYNVMQSYRMSDFLDQKEVSAAFHNVKDFIREKLTGGGK